MQFCCIYKNFNLSWRIKNIMGQRNTAKKISNTSMRMLVLLFAVLYIAATSPLELLHSLSHDHGLTVIHSDEQEEVPCHRLIYHNDIEKGCHHDSHLLVSDKCQMCDLAFHGDKVVLRDVDISTPRFEQTFFCFYKQDLDSYRAVISSSRAPPASV